MAQWRYREGPKSSSGLMWADDNRAAIQFGGFESYVNYLTKIGVFRTHFTPGVGTH